MDPSTFDIFEVLGRSVEKVRKTLLEQIAEHVFARWHTAFIAKAVGGEDEFGEKWHKLHPNTIKQKLNPKTDPLQKASFTNFRDLDYKKLWKQRKDTLQSQLMRAGMSKADAADKANSLMWGELTADANVPINIRTGRLERSLRPEGSGVNKSKTFTGGTRVAATKIINGAVKSRMYSGGSQSRISDADQIREVYEDRVVVGTRVPYAADVDATRRFKPNASELAVWVADIAKEARNQIIAEAKL